MPRLTWFFVAGYVQAHFALIVPLVPLAKILPVTLGALAMSSMAIFVCLMALSNFRSDEAFLGRPTDGCADTMDEEVFVCGLQRLKAMVAKTWELLRGREPMD